MHSEKCYLDLTPFPVPTACQGPMSLSGYKSEKFFYDEDLVRGFANNDQGPAGGDLILDGIAWIISKSRSCRNQPPPFLSPPSAEGKGRS